MVLNSSTQKHAESSWKYVKKSFLNPKRDSCSGRVCLIDLLHAHYGPRQPAIKANTSRLRQVSLPGAAYVFSFYSYFNDLAFSPVPVGSEWHRWHHEVDTLRNFLSSPTKPLHATIVVGSKDPAVNWESLEKRHIGILERECWQHVEHILQGAEFLMDAAKRRRVQPIPRSGIHPPPVVILGHQGSLQGSSLVGPRVITDGSSRIAPVVILGHH